MFPRLPARATFVADTNFVSGTKILMVSWSATNVSQFARARKRHEQQCFRNNVSSFATAFKVAEHSFRARSCLRNSARAQILHKNKHGINSTIILFQFPRYLFYFCFTNEYNVLMVLLFYYKGMLEKVTMQRTQQFSAFVCYRKNPVKCSACVVSRKNCD